MLLCVILAETYRIIIRRETRVFGQEDMDMRALTSVAISALLTVGCAARQEQLDDRYHEQRKLATAEQTACNARYPDKEGYFHQWKDCRLRSTATLAPYLPPSVNAIISRCSTKQLALASSADRGQLSRSEYHAQDDEMVGQCMASIDAETKNIQRQRLVAEQE